MLYRPNQFQQKHHYNSWYSADTAPYNSPRVDAESYSRDRSGNIDRKE